MKQSKAAYDMKYAKENVIKKLISFNKNKPEDMMLLDWLNQRPNVNQYVKRLIREDMKKGWTPIEPQSCPECSFFPSESEGSKKPGAVKLRAFFMLPR